MPKAPAVIEMAVGTKADGGEISMNGLLALISAIFAAGSFYCFYAYKTGVITLVLGAAFILLTVVFGGIFFSTKVNKKEDIHITD